MIKTTLHELSKELIKAGYPDLFDFQVDGDILNLNHMIGYIADVSGARVFEFKIIKIGTNADQNGYITHLDTIVKYNENDI